MPTRGGKERKLAVLGYRSVGKTSLIVQFVEGQFVESYNPTIENTFTKTTRIHNQDYLLKIVDTIGQDEFSLFPTQYSIDVHGYVFVYSVTSTKSFDIVKVLLEKLHDLTGRIQVPIVLVGNKVDLAIERMISYEEGKRLADDWNAVFLESSAKQNNSVSDVFHRLLLEIDRADTRTDDKSNCAIA